MVPMRLAEYKARERNVGKPKHKKESVSTGYRRESGMTAALERYHRLLEGGGKRVEGTVMEPQDIEVVEHAPRKRKKTASKMDAAMERFNALVSKKRIKS
jgi:hypothetical protein